MIQRALVSVFKKDGIIDFARALQARKVEIVSTGGTARLLTENGIKVIEVSTYTGMPEMMDGRLKTLHPKIHGGLLGRRDIDAKTMREHGIDPIDLLVVNLYPFEQIIAKPDCDLATTVENIDIGGSTMLRAAAKNYASVGVVVDTDDYTRVLDEMNSNDNALTDDFRFDLAVKAFKYTAHYDKVIAEYLASIRT